jgi:tetratricopeptide (TPR) repeat protein
MIHRAVGITLLLFLSVVSLSAATIDGEVRIGKSRGLDKPATVQLIRERQIVSEQFTGLDGRFEFLYIEPSRYIVRAKYGDLPESEVEVTLIANASRFRVPITIMPVKERQIGNTGAVSVDQLLVSKAARKEYEEGLKNRKAGNCAKAIPRFEKAISLAAKFGEAYNELGNCLQKQSDIVKAEAAFKKAIALNATIYPTINLADLYVAQKRYDDAQRVIQDAYIKDPTEGDLLFALARVYFEQGRIRDAERAALEAHSRIHRTADVHLLLAKLYLSSKNYPALLTQLQTFLDENPTGPKADEVRRNLKTLQPNR